MISYHPESAKEKVGTTYTYGFKVAGTDDPVRLARGISTYAWSPCTWKDGYRKKANFLAANWFGLDFETHEMTLEGAVGYFCDMVHVIGTTRNHRVSKDGLILDRFRVLIKAERVMSDRYVYEWNMRRLADKWPIDPACCDGARHFFPCREIVSVNLEGYEEEVLTPPKSEAELKEARLKKLHTLKKAGVIPPSLRYVLQTEIRPGERNTSFFKAAKDMLRLGVDGHDIIAALLKSPTARRFPEMESEIKACVRSAQKSLEEEG